MKKILLLSISLIFCVTMVSAQKILKPDVDKFSGDTTWRTSEETIYAKVSLAGANEIVQLQGLKIGSSYILSVVITSPKTEHYYVEDAAKSLFKLADNSVVNLAVAKAGVSSNTGTNTGSLGLGTMNAGTKMLIYYKVTKDDLVKLQTSTLEAARFETSKGPLDYEIKPKLAERFRKVCELLATK